MYNRAFASREAHLDDGIVALKGVEHIAADRHGECQVAKHADCHVQGRNS
jgi:hypothetical protein